MRYGKKAIRLQGDKALSALRKKDDKTNKLSETTQRARKGKSKEKENIQN